MEACRGGFTLTVGIRAIIPVTEVVVRFVAARWTPRTMQTIVAVIIVELICRKMIIALISISSHIFLIAYCKINRHANNNRIV